MNYSTFDAADILGSEPVGTFSSESFATWLQEPGILINFVLDYLTDEISRAFCVPDALHSVGWVAHAAKGGVVFLLTLLVMRGGWLSPEGEFPCDGRRDGNVRLMWCASVGDVWWVDSALCNGLREASVHL